MVSYQTETHRVEMRGEEDHICKLDSARSDCLEDFLAAEKNNNFISLYIERRILQPAEKGDA